MVNQTRKKGSGITFVLPPTREEAAAPAALVAEPGPSEAPSPAPGVRPRGRTGVGLLTASVFEGTRLQEQVAELNATVERLTAERGAQRLDPKTVAPSRWANRHPDAFEGPAFEQFKSEIRDAGGNVQPIKVRPLATPGSGGVLYEVVFGHRRHRACLELGLAVLAVVDDLQDVDLFVQMERENRGRESLSAWEQGLMYLRALEEGLFPSNTKLAAAIGRDSSDVGKALRIVRLPQEVTSAFPSPTAIQFRWVAEIERALKLHEGKVLAAARDLTKAVKRPTAAEAFVRLTACLREGPATDPLPEARTMDFGNAGKGEIRADAKGRTIVELPAGALPPDRWNELQAAIKALLV